MPMTLISRTTLTTSAASVTFNSIPQTFQTLKLVVSIRGTTHDGTDTWNYHTISLNDSSSSFTQRALYGTDVTGSSNSTNTSTPYNGENGTASTFSNAEIVFPNYSGSTNKPFSIDSVTENNATNAVRMMQAMLWSNNSAISSMKLTPATGSFVANSTFSLYGIS